MNVKPVPKVTAAGIGGASAVLVMILFAAFTPELYGRMPAGAEGAFTYFLTIMAAWIKSG